MPRNSIIHYNVTIPFPSTSWTRSAFIRAIMDGLHPATTRQCPSLLHTRFDVDNVSIHANLKCLYTSRFIPGPRRTKHSSPRRRSSTTQEHQLPITRSPTYLPGTSHEKNPRFSAPGPETGTPRFNRSAYAYDPRALPNHPSSKTIRFSATSRSIRSPIRGSPRTQHHPCQ